MYWANSISAHIVRTYTVYTILIVVYYPRIKCSNGIPDTEDAYRRRTKWSFCVTVIAGVVNVIGTG